MSVVERDPIYLDICHKLDSFCKHVQEKVDEEQQQLKAQKRNVELEEKLAHELKKNAELTRQLKEVSARCSELDQLCSKFPAQLTISDNDQARLDQAKTAYEIAKELTGVRFDYSAPPNVAKGYVKNEALGLLQPFRIEQESRSALWAVMESVAAPAWGLRDKENRPPNRVDKHTK